MLNWGMHNMRLRGCGREQQQRADGRGRRTRLRAAEIQRQENQMGIFGGQEVALCRAVPTLRLQGCGFDERLEPWGLIELPWPAQD